MQPDDTQSNASEFADESGHDATVAGEERTHDSLRQPREYSEPRRFHPGPGLLGSHTPAFDRDVRELLHHRLLFSSLLLSAGFGAFLVHSLLHLPPAARTGWLVIAHGLVTVLEGGIAALLFSRLRPSLAQLRWLEVAVFGAAGLFFVMMRIAVAGLIPVFDVTTGGFVPVDQLPADYQPPPADGSGQLPLHPAAVVFAPYTVIPWILLIQMYGVFIPSTLLRATVMVGVMAVCPVAIVLFVASRNPDVALLLWTGDLTAVVLWMSLACIAGVYGSWRFGKLRKDAFAAREIGAYTLQQKLGAGGMGEVYLARHRLLKRKCAVKLIRPEKAEDISAIARFEGEVQATAGLTHPNTVEIYDYGRTDDGTFYYVMEYLPGLSLRHIVDRFGPLSPGRTVYLLRQVCRALSEAHGTGLIHRDLKPGNIFAAERGGMFDVAKLLDFGLVKSLHPEDDSLQLTVDGTIVGSPLYAAPESTLDEKPDPRSDLYSLGATAYWLLTSKPVFDYRKPLKVLFAHANEQPQPPSIHNPDIPADLEAVIMRCLEKKRSDRYASAAELEIALGSCQCATDWNEPAARNWWRERVAAHRAPQEAAAGSASLSTRDGNQTATLARTVDHQETTNDGD